MINNTASLKGNTDSTDRWPPRGTKMQQEAMRDVHGYAQLRSNHHWQSSCRYCLSCLFVFSVANQFIRARVAGNPKRCGQTLTVGGGLGDG